MFNIRQKQASFPSFNDSLTHELIYMTENHASQNQSCTIDPKNKLGVLAKLEVSQQYGEYQ